MKKDEVLLGTVPHDNIIEVTVEKSRYFPEGEITRINACACIKKEVLPDGNLKMSIKTAKLPEALDHKAQSWLVGVVTTKASYGFVIRALVTQRTLTFKK